MFFFDLMVIKFTLELLSKNISKIRYIEYCILYRHRFINLRYLYLHLKEIKVMFLLEGSIVKNDVHMYFYASFLGIG